MTLLLSVLCALLVAYLLYVGYNLGRAREELFSGREVNKQLRRQLTCAIDSDKARTVESERLRQSLLELNDQARVYHDRVVKAVKTHRAAVRNDGLWSQHVELYKAVLPGEAVPVSLPLVGTEDSGVCLGRHLNLECSRSCTNVSDSNSG